MANVEVRARECACPGTPHEDGDLVYLRPTLGIEGGLEAEVQLIDAVTMFPLDDKATKAEERRVETARSRFLRPKWFATFIRHGAVGWNLVDKDGAPVPFDAEAIVDDYGLARLVAEKANDLYGASVLAPFTSPPPKHLRNGRTDGGTHPPTTRTRSRSRRSSPPASAGPQSEMAVQ